MSQGNSLYSYLKQPKYHFSKMENSKVKQGVGMSWGGRYKETVKKIEGTHACKWKNESC
jgi:hypothetical protein